MYVAPEINLFHTLKLGPISKESANFFNKSWVIDGTMIVEECLGTSDGAARSPPLFPRPTATATDLVRKVRIWFATAISIHKSDGFGSMYPFNPLFHI